jgi:hypothetical protein
MTLFLFGRPFTLLVNIFNIIIRNYSKFAKNGRFCSEVAMKGFTKTVSLRWWRSGDMLPIDILIFAFPKEYHIRRLTLESYIQMYNQFVQMYNQFVTGTEHFDGPAGCLVQWANFALEPGLLAFLGIHDRIHRFAQVFLHRGTKHLSFADLSICH